MKRHVCFEMETGEKFRFEVKAQVWLECISNVLEQKNISQDTLKRVINESADEMMVGTALSYYTNQMSFEDLNKIISKFAGSTDVYYGAVEYCTINRKKFFLKKIMKEGKDADIRERAREALAYLSNN